MATSRLQLYNDALLLLGERAITALTDVSQSRSLLDTVWTDGGVNLCLEEGQWEFAMRTIRIDYDPGITPSYGYARAFDKPTDWILTSAVCTDEFFRVPTLRYVDESGFWYSDLDQLYVRYVSNDTAYGMNLALWPQTFADFVAAHFATKIILQVSNDPGKLKLFINPENSLHSIRGRALLNAKSRCAMASPTQLRAQGNWAVARTRGVARRDGGPISGDLIG